MNFVGSDEIETNFQRLGLRLFSDRRFGTEIYREIIMCKPIWLALGNYNTSCVVGK